MSHELQLDASGLPVFFQAEHEAAAHAMTEAAKATTSLLAARWRLPMPQGCELHVLTDCFEFIDRTAPTLLRPLLRITQRWWRPRAERAFALAGGWTIPWKSGPAVGVKPPELLLSGEPSLGDRLFVAIEDPLEKVKHLTGHELTHAFTAHLRLPSWLNEGLAMRAVDHLAGFATVREETRRLAQFDPEVLDSRAYRRIASSDHDALIRLYATGYWVTRRLDEERSPILSDLLEGRRPAREATQAVQTFLHASPLPGEVG